MHKQEAREWEVVELQEQMTIKVHNRVVILGKPGLSFNSSGEEPWQKGTCNPNLPIEVSIKHSLFLCMTKVYL